MLEFSLSEEIMGGEMLTVMFIVFFVQKWVKG